MLLWFVGGSIVIIWFVFTDPAFDYRLLPVGATLPALVELPTGRATMLEALVVGAGLLGVVMIVTKRRSRWRTLAMGVPLGWLLFLTLTGAWRTAEVFFWPAFGWRLPDVENPILARGWWNVPLELVGGIACWWVWTRAHLSQADRRREFVRTGRLDLPKRT